MKRLPLVALGIILALVTSITIADQNRPDPCLQEAATTGEVNCKQTVGSPGGGDVKALTVSKALRRNVAEGAGATTAHPMSQALFRKRLGELVRAKNTSGIKRLFRDSPTLAEEFVAQLKAQSGGKDKRAGRARILHQVFEGILHSAQAATASAAARKGEI